MPVSFTLGELRTWWCACKQFVAVPPTSSHVVGCTVETEILELSKVTPDDDDELTLNVLRCHLTY